MQISALYDVPIYKHEKGSLSEQVYQILLKEIVNLRWGIGERMPSFNDFLDLSGLSRYPIENALNRLEEEGLITKIKQKGIFLKSNTPNNAILGTILIITENHNYQSPYGGKPKFSPEFGWVNISDIEQLLGVQGYRTAVIDIEENHIDKASRDVIHSDDVIGIISMVPNEMLNQIGVSESLPVVFLGINDSLSKPCVGGDLFMAAYTLTTELIAAGHEKIGIYANYLWASPYLDQVIAGHQKAMSLAGLKVDVSSIEFTKNLNPQDLSGIRDYLKAFPENTGLICLNIDNACKFVEYGDLVGLKVPEDLSIVSLQAGFMRTTYGKAFVGVMYDWVKILKLCQKVLFDDRNDRPINRFEFNFKLDPKGVSIAFSKNEKREF